MAKFARYGPSPRYGLPEAGLCLSSFAIIRQGDEILLGQARDHPRWAMEWAPNFPAYDPEELEEQWHTWRFPAAYLYEGEHPDDTLRRVVADQLGVEHYETGPARIHSFYDPSDWFPGKLHYDLCFVYDVEASPPPSPPPWFSKLHSVDPSALRRGDFGSAMGDLAVVLDLAKD